MVSSVGAPAAPRAPVVPADPFAASESSIVLEVTRGQTRYRRRPVTGPRFLIGAGVTCDLRLGGDGMPPLHSLITQDGGRPHLEAIAPVPPLVVNGRTVRETTLRDGDVIDIGEVELVARVRIGAPAGAETHGTETSSVDLAPPPLAELSAAELIDRIETEELEVEQFEMRQATGARGLFHAAAARRAAPARREEYPSERAVPAPHFLSKRPQVLAGRRHEAVGAVEAAGARRDLSALSGKLAALSQQLDAAAARSTWREESYAQAAESLLETQERLVGQIEALVAQVESLQQEPVSTTGRAIA